MVAPRIAFKPSRMPDAAKALVYLNDLQGAVSRMGEAWNTKQIKDSLESVYFWASQIENSLKEKD